MRTLVVGAGAVGGYFGGRMLAAGRDVHFLVRAKRAELLAGNGLQIRSPVGDLNLQQPPTVLKENLEQSYDLIILSCKAYDLADAIDSFAAGVGPQTVILPLLNGMLHLDVLSERFGAEKILGGQCVIASTVDADGAIRHLNTFHGVTFGERDGAMSARVGAIEKEMAGVGFDVNPSPAILQSMWEKWIMLASLAGSTSLMRSSIGPIMEAPGGLEFVSALLEECSGIAAANGHAPGGPFYERTRKLLTEAGSTLTASMFRDIGNGARIEADHIIGDLLRRGREAAVKTDLLQVVYTHLKTYEARNRAASA
ncbi:2-dehydropantoate 2-reductase [Herbaspirillum sp. RV1423]|uniref:2-dehydropantoate 2-reductase n=1 Tax=Herbaspirillum sp. RV1423 TaxID=1443993 RepID=UPI0004B8C7C8|nr:2-dehydropantoate 2-reductase [Herbaspirillum sp. RV1423]